jgi:predicted phosphodiesterase
MPANKPFVSEWLKANWRSYAFVHELIAACCEQLGVNKKTAYRTHKLHFGSMRMDNVQTGHNFRVRPPLNYDVNGALDHSVKNARKVQRLNDINRVERAAFRSDSRLINGLDELQGRLIEMLGSNTFTEPKRMVASAGGRTVGILQLSDLHFNMCQKLIGNTYNFEVASVRLWRFVKEALQYFKGQNVGKVVVAMTGDLVTSDRRLDEMLNNATNRSLALFTGVDLLQQVLKCISAHHEVTVVSVVGNESRMGDEMGFSDKVLSDSYDMTIFRILELLFRDWKSVHFLHGDPVEFWLTVNHKNVLFLHGFSQKAGYKDMDNFAEKVRSRYVAKSILIDYIIAGHIHTPFIGDKVGRSGSLPGADSYAERSLNTTARASQNLYVVSEKGIDGIKVDLQDATGEGFEYVKPEIPDRLPHEVNP